MAVVVAEEREVVMLMQLLLGRGAGQTCSAGVQQSCAVCCGCGEQSDRLRITRSPGALQCSLRRVLACRRSAREEIQYRAPKKLQHKTQVQDRTYTQSKLNGQQK